MGFCQEEFEDEFAKGLATGVQTAEKALQALCEDLHRTYAECAEPIVYEACRRFMHEVDMNQAGATLEQAANARLRAAKDDE
jgi:hypothetical protein